MPTAKITDEHHRALQAIAKAKGTSVADAFHGAIADAHARHVTGRRASPAPAPAAKDSTPRAKAMHWSQRSRKMVEGRGLAPAADDDEALGAEDDDARKQEHAERREREQAIFDHMSEDHGDPERALADAQASVDENEQDVPRDKAPARRSPLARWAEREDGEQNERARQIEEHVSRKNPVQRRTR